MSRTQHCTYRRARHYRPEDVKGNNAKRNAALREHLDKLRERSPGRTAAKKHFHAGVEDDVSHALFSRALSDFADDHGYAAWNDHCEKSLKKLRKRVRARGADDRDARRR